MGVVYKARQTQLSRIVALKVILSGAHAGPDDLARFRTEAEAIARLQHPNIVQVFEVGEYGGLPFFSLEFCPGGSLEKRLNGTPLPPRKAAKLVEDLARAMHAAHRENVIHRDLKPANVLLAADGTPKITDFGLAKKLDEDGRTQSGAIMGTPSYMAPEQAAASRQTIGPAADVYALGAILYELLTGRPPFKAATPLDTILQVVSDEPVPPTQLQSKTPRDLETICLKCLQKEPKRRYKSAQELAEDLRSWREGEPITARSVGRFERLIKWAKRKPTAAALVGVSVLAVVSLLAGGVFFTVRLSAQVKRAEGAEKDAEARAAEADKQRNRAESARHAVQIQLALSAWERHDVVEAERVLGEVAEPFLPMWETRHVRDLCRRKAMPLVGPATAFGCVAFSGDGQYIVTGNQDHTVRVWEVSTGREIRVLKGHTRPLRSVAISADGRRVVSGSEDSTLRVWDVQAGTELVALRRGDLNVFVLAVAISANGQRFASTDALGHVRVWDALSGGAKPILEEHLAGSWSVAMSADGRRLVYGGGKPDKPGELIVWDTVSGQKLLLKAPTDRVGRVVISADGRRAVSASFDGTVRVWDTATGEEKLALKGQWWQIALSADGERLAMSMSGGTVRVWDIAAKSQRLALELRHGGGVSGVALSPDGRLVLSAGGTSMGGAGKVLLWDVAAAQAKLTLKGDTSSVAISADGQRIVSAGGDQGKPSEIQVWDGRTGREIGVLRGHTGHVSCVAISADGQRVVSGGGDFGGTEPPGVRPADDRRGVSGGGDFSVRVWDVVTGQQSHVLKGHRGWVRSVAISADGQWIASGGMDARLKVWDAVAGQEKFSFQGLSEFVSVAFSADGQFIVAASLDKIVRVWDVASGQEKLSLKGHTEFINSVAFSPDGQRIVSATGHFVPKPDDLRVKPGEVKVWDAATGEELLSLRGHTVPVWSVTWGANGQRIVSGGGVPGSPGEVKVWDAATGQELLSLKGHAGSVSSVAFSANGQRIVSAGSGDQTTPSEISVWDAPWAEEKAQGQTAASNK
jgi:WD40 repeat protein